MKTEKAKNYKRKSLIKNFYDNGFVFIKNEIPKPLLKKIKDEWNRIFIIKTGYSMNEGVKLLNKTNKKLLYKICLGLPKSKDFLKVFEIACKRYFQIYDKKNTFCLDNSLIPGIPNDKRLVYNFHQESQYYPNIENVLTVWFPIFFTANKKNGSMSALLGSHKLGRINNTTTEGKQNGFKSYVPNKIDMLKENYKEILYEAQLGDVVYFHQNLLHKSNSNSTKNCRIIGQFRIADNI